MATQLSKTRLTVKRVDIISSVPQSDNSFWFSDDIKDWIRGYKTRTRNRKNEFKDHEDKVMAFKRKML